MPFKALGSLGLILSVPEMNVTAQRIFNPRAVYLFSPHSRSTFR